MRVATIAFALVLSACGTTVGATGSGRPSAAPSAAPTASPRITSAATLDCTVSWVDHFTTLGQLAAKAEVIVRSAAISQDTVQLTPGFGSSNTRDARRTTFRVIETLKGSAPAEVRVLEDVCPNLDVRPGEEWLLFAYSWDNTHGPVGGGEHFMTRGGPQGQFRFAAGKVSGPFFTFAGVVHSYEGAGIDEVLRDVRTVLR